ncbi:MAG: DUF1398 family protein [Bacteroidota bacterium]
MELHERIQKAYKNVKSYPELVKKMLAVKIKSYTVDVATGTILYRFSKGRHVLHPGTAERNIAAAFNNDQTIKAIRDNQQGKTDYPAFMEDIAVAGIRFYEATLEGDNKRVTYIGSGGFYEESIPV